MSKTIHNIDWVRLVVWLVLVVVIVAGWFWFQRARRDVMERFDPTLRVIRLREKEAADFDASENNRIQERLRTNSIAHGPPKFGTTVTEMTDAQKIEVSTLFTNKLRPALEKWGAAYANRIPFNLNEVTLDKFHSTLGSHMFTFMVGDTTLTFVTDRNPNAPAKVGYLMVRRAALDMNRVPDNGFLPNLNLPVTSEEVIRMVQADCGIEFKPNEVIIRPTAKASALNGGAFVDLLPTGLDPNNALNYKLSMTFDSSGKLVDYERDPSF